MKKTLDIKWFLMLIGVGLILSLIPQWIPIPNIMIAVLIPSLSYSFLVLAFVGIHFLIYEKWSEKLDRPICLLEYLKLEKAFGLISLGMLLYGCKLLFQALDLPQADLFQFLALGLILVSPFFFGKKSNKHDHEI